MGILNDNVTFATETQQTPTSEQNNDQCINTQRALIPLYFSVFVILILVILERRNRPHRCGWHPGLVYPADLLSYKTDTFGYAAAFGSMATLCWSLFLDNQLLGDIPAWGKTFVYIAYVLLIGTMYYPLFICLHTPWIIIGSVFGLIFSVYWTWYYIEAVICEIGADGNSTGWIIAQTLPAFACFSVLSVIFILRLVKRVRVIVGNRLSPCQLIQQQEKPEEKIAIPANIAYVKKLLAQSLNEPVTNLENNEPTKYWNRTRTFLSRQLYRNDPTFKYSPRVVAIFTVGVICSYQFGIVIVLLTYYLQERISELSKHGTKDIVVYVGIWLLKVFQYSSIISLILSSCLTLFSISQILANYRQNMKKMFKGDCSHLPFKRDKRYNEFILSDSLCYAGSQIAYMLWGYIVSYIVLLLTCVLVAVCLILPLFNIIPRNVFTYVGNLILGIIILQILYILQKLACRTMLHRQKVTNGDGKVVTQSVLAIDNRKVYHNMSYFLFFLYIILGLYGCFVKMIKSIVIWIFFLARIDKCGLIQGFETFDMGYMYYVSFLYVEEAHRHPVVVVFCDILNEHVKYKALGLQSFPPNGQSFSQIERPKLAPLEGYERAKKRWHKAYTLLRNPSLQPTERA